METNQVRNDEIEIDLKELFSALLGKAWMMLLAGLILGGVTFVWAKMTTIPQYQSVTKMYVISQQDGSGLTSADFSLSTYLTNDCPEIIKSRTVIESVIDKLDLDQTYEQLKGKVSVTASSATRIVTISVVDEDPKMARDIANAVRNAAANSITRIMKLEAVTVVDEANTPEAPLAQGIMKKTVLAVMLGCMLVAGTVLVKYLMDDTIRVADDVEKYLGLSVLGMIPMDEQMNDKDKKK